LSTALAGRQHRVESRERWRRVSRRKGIAWNWDEIEMELTWKSGLETRNVVRFWGSIFQNPQNYLKDRIDFEREI
jgi:hypothetical protein